jgi:hydroxymethylpyrimidine kinase / phosphomethylpyrimidine kinase / thiamine-phosphate diphosphorylase
LHIPNFYQIFSNIHNLRCIHIFENLMKKPIVLTIAGSDPTGGAGIQADIRAFESTGVYGMSVITAITVQTVEKVLKWEAIESQLVKDQLTTLLDHYPIKVVKCGMIPNKGIVDVIIEAKNKYKFTLIVDPIILSGSGVALGTDGVKEYMISNLFPLVDCIIPNASEVQAITGIQIDTIDDILMAGEHFEKMGIKNVIFKGGHINPDNREVIDYILMDGAIEMFSRGRVNEGTMTHGTGCIFSAIFTGQYALVGDFYTALSNTEKQIELAFSDLFEVPLLKDSENSQDIGGKILDVGISSEDREILEEVVEVYQYISSERLFSDLIAEVRMNISICKKGAKDVSEVAAVEGRITVVNGMPYASGPIKFGVSNHTGRLVLMAHKKDQNTRAVVNVRFIPELIKYMAEEGLYLFEIKRSDQSDKTENKTMQWVIKESYSIVNRIPDIIWDQGEPEKEPMLRLFAENGKQLIEKLMVVLRSYRKLKSDS